MSFHHVPVMPEEAIAALNIKPEGAYLDGTAGGGGHSLEIAKRLTTGRLICTDKDPQAVAAAANRLSQYPGVQVVQGDFADFASVLDELGVGELDGALLDLGVSSHQVDTPERGFSYHQDAPLDMRMSSSGTTAAQLLGDATEDKLAGIFRRYGEERFAGRIARNIVLARETQPIQTTAQLAEIIRSSIPAPARREGGHPAKRVFQALRIAVNGELDSLSACLDSAFDRLAPGGRFVVITFHSLEDRMVKQAFAAFAKGCECPPSFPICVCGKKPRGKLVGRKPQLPTPEEISANSRAKSAKLRVIEKLS